MRADGEAAACRRRARAREIRRLRPTAPPGRRRTDTPSTRNRALTSSTLSTELDRRRRRRRRSSRLAASRAREETRRKLALLRNPADLLREVTAAGGSGGGVSRVDARLLACADPQPLPIIPTEKPWRVAQVHRRRLRPAPGSLRGGSRRRFEKSRTNSRRRRRRSRREARLDDLLRRCKHRTRTVAYGGSARVLILSRSARHARGGERRPAPLPLSPFVFAWLSLSYEFALIAKSWAISSHFSMPERTPGRRSVGRTW